ncbi:IS630 family transposase [Streptomyces sp. ISL-1]|uniref:IS630 family transposase n=1 Tax=Streptomyces sp. ISL-1 TaxID=2817657 RepID=UPI0035ABB3C2
MVLSEAERAELTRWARRAKIAQFLALRAKIVLRCAEGGTNKEIAAELGVSHGTVNRWRSRFIRLRLDGLTDEPRPGRPPSILLDQVEDVLTATLESTPGRDTHWSRASMAKHSGLSKSTIGRIWKKFDLKPHLQDAFKLSTDPQFIAKVVDVVGLYHHPPEKAVVLCVDEKSQIPQQQRPQPLFRAYVYLLARSVGQQQHLDGDAAHQQHSAGPPPQGLDHPSCQATRLRPGEKPSQAPPTRHSNPTPHKPTAKLAHRPGCGRYCLYHGTLRASPSANAGPGVQPVAAQRRLASYQ